MKKVLMLCLVALMLGGCGTPMVQGSIGNRILGSLDRAVSIVNASLDVTQLIECYHPESGGCGKEGEYVSRDFYPVSMEDALEQQTGGATLITSGKQVFVRRYFRIPYEYTFPGYHLPAQQWPPVHR